MAKTLILNQADLRACVGLDSASLAVVTSADNRGLVEALGMSVREL